MRCLRIGRGRELCGWAQWLGFNTGLLFEGYAKVKLKLYPTKIETFVS
jgi:hypothetical protein